MSIFPKYQPIQFEEYLPNECRAEMYDFQSIAEQGDYATFQVTVAPCEGTENIIPNPDFDPSESVEPNWEWTITGGFSTPGSGACKANDGSTASLFKDDLFVIGNAYQISIQLSSLNGSLQIYNGGTLVYTVYTLGVTTFSFIATAESLTLSFDDPENYGCIDSVEAMVFSANMAFGIIDENGDTAFVADFENNPEYFTFVENTVTIRFLWSDLMLANGCYRIGFSDGCTNTNAQFGIFNEGFCSSSAGWIVDNGDLADGITFDVDGDPLECTLNVSNDPVTVNAMGSITSSATELTVGMCYEVTIPSITTGGDGVVTFNLGTTAHNIDLQVVVFPYTFQATCAGNGTFSIGFDMETSNLILMEGGFSLRLCDTADYEFDYMSQSFKLADDHPCTHLISLTCEDNALNYVFVGSGFEPSVRLESEIYNSAPEEIRKAYHDNLGTKKVTYGEYRKHFFFVIEMIPAWLLDFFYLCRIADNFYIDGDAYFMEGETPSPEWATDITNFATLRTEISEKTQLARNANINTSECAPIALNNATCLELNDEDTGLTVVQKDSLFYLKGTKTGQTTSYEAGDDGERQAGRGVSFGVLSCNNWFGNTNRFTATDGSQTLVDDVMLDWQEQLMWYVLPFGTVATWTLAMSGAEGQSVGGYSDWTLPNIKQLTSLINYGMSDTMNYSPLSISSTPYANIWSSTTNPNATTEAYRINPVNGNVNGLTKATAGVYYIICRHFTKDDLGL